TEAIFKRLKGVGEVTSGYSGGGTKNPSYEEVSSGLTGHAEAIQIKFAPKTTSYEKLLEIFWATHDPTTLNRQGPDVGTQYRSAIFYHNEKQHREAEDSKKALEDKIVTEILPFNEFFPAESYHQTYYELNKTSNPYCSIVIDPKIKKLLDKFNSDVKEEYK
ncbi:MAG: peptide-methionine (S)-S-oxide reductase, partial [Candidatus Woykebacteria bacterium RBG_13_40_7b]